MNKRTLFVLVLSVALIGLSGASQAKIPDCSVTYLGWNSNWNSAELRVDITPPEPGRLVYVENYYSVDSEGKPKFYSSSRLFDEVVGTQKVSFNILRPKDGRGTRYSLIEKVFIVNGDRTTAWVDLHKYWN